MKKPKAELCNGESFEGFLEKLCPGPIREIIDVRGFGKEQFDFADCKVRVLKRNARRKKLH